LHLVLAIGMIAIGLLAGRRLGAKAGRDQATAATE
jgi:hypothetical protein